MARKGDKTKKEWLAEEVAKAVGAGKAVAVETDVELLETTLQPGKRVTHSKFGDGVVIEVPRDGYVRAFFGSGERQVAIASVRPQLSRNERIIQGVAGTWDRLKQL